MSTSPAPSTTTTTTAAPIYTVSYTGGGCVGGVSQYQLGGAFNTGDTVVVRAAFSGYSSLVTTYNGRADLYVSNAATSNNADVLAQLGWQELT